MDDKLKQRLVGAVVLVALAVIVLPALFDGAGRRAREEAAFEIPPPPQLPQRPLATLEPLQPVPRPGQVDPQPAGASTPGEPQTPRAWAVQVGAFGSRANAQVLRDKLRADGYAAFVEAVDASPRYRVRVGPEADKARAEQLQEKLQREFGHQGLVVRYP